MIKSGSFSFLKNRYSRIYTEETKINYKEKEKNKILVLRKKLNLSFSKDKIKQKKKISLNIIPIKLKIYKQKIPLPNISSSIHTISKESKEIINNKKNKKRIYSSNILKPKNYNISDNIEDKIICTQKLLYLKNKFLSKINMSKGEIVEMKFGKKIKFDNILDIFMEKNKRIKEIIYNNPKFIINLIEIGKVDKNDIYDFFNIESFNISWNEILERSYREIRKISSNIFKIISFLSKTRLIGILKKNFESKNYMNFDNYNQKEIEKIYDIYEKLKKYDNEKIKEALDKINEIYYIRDILLKEKISKIRNEYYSNKLKNYNENKKYEINLKELTEKGKIGLIEIKNCIFHIRQNTNWKIFPYKNINRLKFSKPITKYNEIIKKEIDVENIEFKDKIIKEKIYIKEKIKILKKENIFQKADFNWNKFIKNNIENKKIIDYYVTIIQSNFRSFMVKIFINKLIKSVNSIIINLYEYSKFKQLILTMYKMTYENDTNNIKLNQINKVLNIIIKNCRTRKLIFKKYEVDMINKITKSNIGILPLEPNQEIYSNIPLIYLLKFINYIIKYHL